MMRKNFDISSIRERLAGQTGQKYWRSLEELAETEAFKDFLQHEFPQGVDQWLNPVSRRNFLKLMAASLALGGLSACSAQQAENIVPYVEAPEMIVPGESLFFATAMQLGGVAIGLLAESRMGRPIKIEGNPDHQASLGATDNYSQASILNLYDPDRARTVTQAGLVTTWNNFLRNLNVEVERQRLNGGAGFRILTETVTSPSLASQIEAILDEFPEARWHQYEPINRDNVHQGAILAFGEAVNTVYRFDQAQVVVSLEADFMGMGPARVRYTRDFSDGRRVREDQREMNRLYVIESTPTVTGAMADHRLPLRSSQIEAVAWALASALDVAVDAPAENSLAGVPENWIEAIVEDLQANQGASIVIAGDHQPPVVHALVHAINDALGNVNQTVLYTDPLEANPVNQFESLQELVTDMAAGQVELLVIMEANPVYTAPADLNFAEHLLNVNFRVRQGLYEDETSALCHWHIPTKHYLESWGDARAFDGTVTLVQPLIEPLYEDRSEYQLLATILGNPGLTGYDVVREYWQGQNLADDFEQFWLASLRDGFLADTALEARSVALNLGQLEAASEPAGESLEIVFRPDPTLWDGRFANNGWLQELPKPLTKLTWDNVALISPATAERLGLMTEDVVELHLDGRMVEAPVWVQPGQAENSVAVWLGHGRVRAGRVGSGVGFNAYLLRPFESPGFSSGLEIRPTGRKYQLATTQSHYVTEGRDLVRVGTIEQYREEPDFVQHMGHHVDGSLSLIPEYDYDSYAWGMAIDLNLCNGCNACVVACQAENNIPVVGKDQVLVSREMHWLRIDTYFGGDFDHPDVYHQPMLCQHCEKAPCELVCPVNATVHDAEGLNVMVYNRCIGTRYCSNNCPYKVRRFNFLHYSYTEEETLKALVNPEVTVRTRGVMEKCTYCVQRISEARINAKKENRRIQDGEVVTACQAACPSRAIYFGDINDPNSEVSRMKAQPQNYGVLTELGTQPRTSYLAKLRNPNPVLVEEASSGEEAEAR
jgi:molybdopterin-containing oxidoreductase family iron-sulfur binding subunit